ncbi:Methyltransferase domain-containing protein [Lentzea aerocolonigenes]|nr:Methyltransferase domain-containing protein [Lentzea aerocolonigenes]
MTALDFPDGSFDGIRAFYSILHVPRAEQSGLIAKIARWLKPHDLDDLVTMHEPDPATFHWVLTRR